MFKLSVKSEFSAAHNLRGYKGKCEALHGHNWKIEAVITAQEAGAQGLVVDFHIVKKALKIVLDEFDHKYLNELAFFKKHNPTSENLAQYIFDALRKQLSKRSCCLKEVTVWESDSCSATYFKEA